MAIDKKQKTAIAAIVIAGLLAGAGLTLTSRGGEPAAQAGKEADGHKEVQGHKEAQGHEDGEHHGAAASHAEPAGHADNEHHREAEGAGHEEGMIAMSEAQIRNAGLALRAAGPARVRDAVQFPGEIRFNEDRTAHVVPRVAGVAEAVPANLGQRVKKGDLLAVFASTQLSDQRSELLAAQRRLELARTTFAREKKLWEDKISAEQDYLAARTALQEAEIAVHNASQKLTAIGAKPAAGGLNRFELRAPFDGIVVEKHLTLGEAVTADTTVFTLSDLSTVWAEFVIAPKDLSHVKLGETVAIASTAFDGKAEGKVSYVGSLLGQQTRTATARVTLANPDMAWRPGLFVTVSVAVNDTEVPLAVEADALQTEGQNTVVFVAVPGGFAARPVKTGRSDGKRVEIVSGLSAGERYVAANSFVLKAELGKASAEHAH